MGRGQPTSRNGGATPASSLIIFLEQRVAELETQRDEAEQFASNMENWITRAEAAEAKVAELEGTYARWKADWVDIDKTREAKVAELEDIIICLETDMPMAVRLLNQRTSINRLTDKNSVLEATIERVSPLPDKWRNSTDVIQASGFGMAGLVQYTITPRDCADELEAALKESGDE